MDSPTPTPPLSPQSKPFAVNENPTTETSPILTLTPLPSSTTKSSRHPKPKNPQSNDSPNQSSPNPRRKRKSRASASAAVTSPRNTRKTRKRLEKEIELVPIEDDVVAGRPKKRRQKNKQQKQPLGLVAFDPSSCSEPKIDGESNVWEAISELVMWKNVAKSTLWFGSGSIFILSSCFSRDSNFSMISAASHLGILILGIAFFRDSLPQRERQEAREAQFQLTEEDFLRAARLVLPMANAVLAECQKIFSGEPSMTLKVAPVLLFGAKYGHLMTPWRLLAAGFLLSFTLPKLYSSYSVKIHQRVKEVKSYAKEAWKSCPCKKLVATSTAMLAWNLFSGKMQIFAAFMSVVVLRHKKQQTGTVSNERQQQQVMLVGP